jgi:hypothetical protein
MRYQLERSMTIIITEINILSVTEKNHAGRKNVIRLKN